MKSLATLLLFLPLLLSGIAKASELPTLASDDLYREIIRTVAEADFDAMAATYHEDAVLVSTSESKLVSKVLPMWRASGEALKREGGKATLSFRFSAKVPGDQTSFSTGIFRYSTTDANGVEKVSYMHFEDLNIKQGSRWLTLMERQLKPASLSEWEALSAWK